jgi:Ca2+-binding EF-hand superfamily protein
LVNKKEAIQEAQENSIKIGKKDRENWYKNRGFTHMFPFTDKELKELKLYFTHLDEDLGGTIGIEELETPLISLGIASSREEV